MRRLGLFLATGLLLVGAALPSPAIGRVDSVRAARFYASAAAARCYPFADDERNFAALSNALRAAEGVPALRLLPAISRVAIDHTAKMAEQQTLFHDLAGNGALLTRWVTLGENVGFGPSVERVQTAFENSPGHRANLVSPDYRHFGVGSTVTEEGTIFVTVIFSGTKRPRSPLCATASGGAPAPSPSPSS